jgi:hypothetical protein
VTAIRMNPMDEPDPFSDSIYEEQTHLAERELSSFIAAVTKLYGPEQAKLAAEDWLDESELMDSPPRSEERDWRAVTIAASARLANRVNASPASAEVAAYADDLATMVEKLELKNAIQVADVNRVIGQH